MDFLCRISVDIEQALIAFYLNDLILSNWFYDTVEVIPANALF